MCTHGAHVHAWCTCARMVHICMHAGRCTCACMQVGAAHVHACRSVHMPPIQKYPRAHICTHAQTHYVAISNPQNLSRALALKALTLTVTNGSPRCQYRSRSPPPRFLQMWIEHRSLAAGRWHTPILPAPSRISFVPACSHLYRRTLGRQALLPHSGTRRSSCRRTAPSHRGI